MRGRPVVRIVVGATAATGLALAVAGPPVSEPAVRFPWWLLIPSFWLAELAVTRISVRGRPWTLSLVEIPMVIGLFFVRPGAVVGTRLAGSVAAELTHRRRLDRDAVARATDEAFITALAAVMFRGVAVPGSSDVVTWGAAFLATLAAVGARHALMLVDGRAAGRPAFLLSVANAMFCTSLALTAVDHLRAEWLHVWLVLLPVVLLWAAVRGYAQQQQRRRMWELLFDQGVFGIGTIDADLRIVSVNDVVCLITGYERSEIVGRSLEQLLHPDDAALAARAARDLIAGSLSSYAAEVRSYARDGRTIWGEVAAWPLREDDGRVKGCLWVLRDVSEIRGVRERLQRIDRRIREGVLLMTEAREPRRVLQAVVDLAREVVEAEYAALGVFGPDGEGMKEFLFSGMGEETIRAIGAPPTGAGLLGAATVAGGPIRLPDLTRFEGAVGFPPGHPEMRSFLGVPIVHRGRALGNLYLANKVGASGFSSEDEALLLAFAVQAAVVIENATMHETERRLIEELDRSNAELKRASAAKSVFLASMSHELRTPLHAMLMAADILSDPAFAVSEQRAQELSQTISTSGRHLIGLIDDLLELSRIETGHFEVRLQPTALALLLADCRQAIASIAAAKRVRLVIPVVDDLWVEVDPLRIRQALLNLLSNAVKFTPRDGEVWVEVHPAATTVTLVVADTGHGIEAGDLERIFDPFQQGGGHAHGIGLGLAITRAIVRAHGGTMQVESSPGRGSRFAVTLTRSALRSVGPGSHAPQRSTDHGSARGNVLVVEDDRQTLELTLDVLSAAGFEADGARSVGDALRHVRRARPDVVVLDVRLGAEDGLDVVRRLRAESETRAIPVVATSASASEADVGRAMEAGCAVFLAKPVAAQRLVRTIEGSLVPSPIGDPP